MSSRPSSEALNLFANLLARQDRGDAVDLEGFCALHPEHAEDLRRLWKEWREISFFRQQLPQADEVERPGPVHKGEEIGDYLLVELLARGGQGEVWIAEQESLGRKVALKLILPERTSSKSRALFAREARAGGRLSHPGIVTVYDHGVSAGHEWIAMELVEGACTLRSFLDELAEEDLPRAYYPHVAEFIARVADALQAAHEAGVIHRDVKPQNILITSDDRPKLTDFGLARIADEAALSKTGDFAGTYAYMSPEQVAARRAGIDHRTDVFSLGVVTYEVLSRRRPFDGDSSHEIAERILTADPPDLRHIDPRIPRDLAVICTKCLSKDRRDRYQSMTELAAELRRFLVGEPILARPPSSTRRLARWAGRHPTGVAVVLTLLLVLVFQLSRRDPGPGPFSGPDYEQRLVADTPASERSPTFLGNRFLVFERTEHPGDAPCLWAIDLTSGLIPWPWSPEGEVCARPSVSPDERWLAYETPAERIDGAGGGNAIVIRRLGSPSPPLEWPAEEYRRLSPGTGSLGGVSWSADSRFLYTNTLGKSQLLMLHDLDAEHGDERELDRYATKDGRPSIPACFSPEGDRVLVALGDEVRTLSLGPGKSTAEIRTLDCGTTVDPVWLRDGSVLLSRQTFKEESERVYLLSAGGTARLRELEMRLIGGLAGLAASPDQSLLALVEQEDTANLYVWSPTPHGGPAPGGASAAGQPANTEVPITRFPPSNVIWTPQEKILFSADTARAMRLFELDPETGSEQPFELQVEGLREVWDSLHLDHPAFSQNGTQLVFRALEDPANGRCDRKAWLVVTPWPPDGTAFALSTEGRQVYYPHVDDVARRVTWTGPRNEQETLFTARIEGRRLVEIEELRSGVQWPARLSGDGEAIAFPMPAGYEFWIQVIARDGTELATIRDAGVNHRPMWLREDHGAGGARQLSYIFSPDPASDRWSVRMVTLEDMDPIELRVPAPPPRNPTFMTYAPSSGRIAYTVRNEKPPNIWLVRPAHHRRNR